MTDGNRPTYTTTPPLTMDQFEEAVKLMRSQAILDLNEYLDGLNVKIITSHAIPPGILLERPKNFPVEPPTALRIFMERHPVRRPT